MLPVVLPVVGVVRGGEKKGTFTPDNAPTALYWLDAPHARRAAGLPDDAWIVDALDGDGSGGDGGGGGFDAGGALARKPRQSIIGLLSLAPHAPKDI